MTSWRNIPEPFQALIRAAKLNTQQRCAGCRVLLVAFGREGDDERKWSCPDCKVEDATVAIVDRS